jgi:dihydroflavonol-4-reductase
MKNVLVIGATGFIGGHIALAAIEQGWRVRGLRRVPGATGHIAQAEVSWYEGDIDHPDSLAQAFENVEIVFHAGGYYPRHSRNVPFHVTHAVKQTRNVIIAARRAEVNRLVFTSTLTTIGIPPLSERRLADERDHYLPGSLARSAYYECKYAMESEVLRAAARGLPAVIVNPTAVFGPGDLNLTLGGAVLAVARGWMVAWLPAQINAVDVRDVAQAQIRASEAGRIGERYILGGHNTTLRELMNIAAEVAGVRPPRFEIPLGLVDLLVWLEDRIPPLELSGNHLRAVRQWQGYNCSKSERELGLNPRPIEATMSEALEWFQAHGHIRS